MIDPRRTLAGGDPRSLGRTQDVVDAVLADRRRLAALFDAVFDQDEIVRMRAGDALEKVCRAKPEWLAPYTERLLTDVAAIEQDSVRWHVAQMLGEVPLSAAHRRRAVRLLESLVEEERSGFVVAHSLTSLASLAESDPELQRSVVALLRRFSNDERGSVAKRASKLLAALK